MSRGALTWFETVWSYGVKAIDYKISSMYMMILYPNGKILKDITHIYLLKYFSWSSSSSVFTNFFHLKTSEHILNETKQ